jgi:hypothetical protein
MRSSAHAVLFPVVAAILLAGCAIRPPTGDTIAQGGPIASAADPAGRMQGYQFARSYEDVVKIDGKNVQQTVEYGFDYARGATVRRITAVDGSPMSEDVMPEQTIRANAAESARMEELVRTHPQLGPLMRQPDLHIHAGGFVMREAGDPYCDIGSRCLRFIVSAGDGSVRVLHAIVDLVSDRVVYPFYDDRTPVVPNKSQGKSP